MPKYEPKAIYRELEKGQVWPVYFVYGPERLKVRELISRIQKSCLSSEKQNSQWSVEKLDGDSVSVDQILNAAQSLTLDRSLRLVLVRDAHLIKDLEKIIAICGEKSAPSELGSVCVLVAKDFDRRKKSSKKLLESAAVVACDEVPEYQRKAWIEYLAKRKKIQLRPELVQTLLTAEPWSLELVDQEIEKWSISQEDEILLGGVQIPGARDFVNAFMSKDQNRALSAVSYFSSEPSLYFPILGLLSWNVKQLALFLGNPKQSSVRNQPFSEWSSLWKIKELVFVQKELADLDFQLKQKPLAPLGGWTRLVNLFCTS